MENYNKNINLVSRLWKHLESKSKLQFISIFFLIFFGNSGSKDYFEQEESDSGDVEELHFGSGPENRHDLKYYYRPGHNLPLVGWGK